MTSLPLTNKPRSRTLNYYRDNHSHQKKNADQKPPNPNPLRSTSSVHLLCKGLCSSRQYCTSMDQGIRVRIRIRTRTSITVRSTGKDCQENTGCCAADHHTINLSKYSMEWQLKSLISARWSHLTAFPWWSRIKVSKQCSPLHIMDVRGIW